MTERNQCDGCAVGAPLNIWDNHQMPDGGRIACTAHLYATPAPARPEPKGTTLDEKSPVKSPAEGSQEDEPVAEYRCRVRALGEIESTWTNWAKCSKATYDAIEGPGRNDTERFEYEVRALYLRPSRAAAPVEGAAWQDIETAPKDGRIVLYWVASARFQEDDETGQLREVDVSAADFGCWKPGGVHGEGYHDPFGGIPGDQGGVTHWMPSPPPPAAPKEKP